MLGSMALTGRLAKPSGSRPAPRGRPHLRVRLRLVGVNQEARRLADRPDHGSHASTIGAGSRAFGLAASRDSVRVTNCCNGTVSRIDPETEAVIATVKTGYHPKWLAVDHRYAWVGITGTHADEAGSAAERPRRP